MNNAEGEAHEAYDVAITMAARLLIACALIVELAALCYGTLVAWLLSAWFVDDALAAGMQPIDWWAIAGERLGVCTLAAILVAICILAVNRCLARVAGQRTSRWPVVTAALFVVLPVGASLAGALQFGITKPYM